MKKGFTLIELLVVIGIISILVAVVLVAIDPATRFAEARNARRWSEVRSILSAVLKYASDNDGDLPAGISTSAKVLGTSGSGCDSTCTATSTASSCLNLETELVDEYLGSIPVDPKTGTDSNTDYYIKKSANGRITVGACDPELGETVYVIR